ncbi:hypothetical protein M444_37950 (plasmid) [Streptomyces sp. Mg1]|nr:hypothetical protein M444_37950 [Streptomyces sp. Mg1]
MSVRGRRSPFPDENQEPVTITSPSSTQFLPDRPGGPAVRALALTTRGLRFAYRSLVCFGWLWIGPMPPDEFPPVLDAPPPGHPERLCRAPLTEAERALDRQLRG